MTGSAHYGPDRSPELGSHELPSGRLVDLYEDAQEPILLIDQSGRIVWGNRTALDFMGTRPVDLQGLSVTELIADLFGYDNGPDVMELDFETRGEWSTPEGVSRIGTGTIVSRIWRDPSEDFAVLSLGLNLPPTDGAEPALPASDGVLFGQGVRRLSGREYQVLELIADGAGNAQIARALGIAKATVQQYTDSARSKLGASSRAELVSVGIAERIIRPKQPGQCTLVAGEVAGFGVTKRYVVDYVSDGAGEIWPSAPLLQGRELVVPVDVWPTGPGSRGEKLDERTDWIPTPAVSGLNEAFGPRALVRFFSFGQGRLRILAKETPSTPGDHAR